MYHLLYIYTYIQRIRNSCFTVQDDRFVDNIGNDNSLQLFSLAETRMCQLPGYLKRWPIPCLRGIGENDIKRIPSA